MKLHFDHIGARDFNRAPILSQTQKEPLFPLAGKSHSLLKYAHPSIIAARHFIIVRQPSSAIGNWQKAFVRPQQHEPF